MKRKYYQEETEINHEYHFIIIQEIIYNQDQKVIYYKREYKFNYQPKKRIKMTKRRNNIEEIVKYDQRTVNVLEETREMTAYEKGKWFERKVNEKLKTEGMITTPSSDGYYDKRKGYVMTGDGGIDISGHYKEKQFIVQCKCHQEPIPASVVREMIGLVMTRKKTLGVICAIKFSPNAVNEAENSNGKVILTTINNIAEQIRQMIMDNSSSKKIKITYQEAKEVECSANTIKMKEMTNGEIIFHHN